MIDPWDRAVRFVLAWEGEWGLTLDDPGGRTRWGISQRAYPDLDLDTLTVESARVLYRRDYWDRCQADLLPWPVALAVFDGAVQHGPRRVIQLLQHVLDVDADGAMGPITLGAVRAKPAAEVFDALLAERALLYDAIDRHFRGWWRRLLACHRLGIETAPSLADEGG